MSVQIVLIGTALLAGFFVTFWLLSRPSPERALLTEVTDQIYHASSESSERRLINVEALASPLGKLRVMLGGGSNPALTRRLMLAGYRKPYHGDLFVVIRLLLPALAGLAVALWVRDNIVLWFILAVVIAFFVPDFWLGYATNRRLEHIRLSLPDALDLLAICLEAGLGLDQAVVRVAKEIKLSHPELSQEFMQINFEQRAGNPRVGAWRNLADRVPVENVRSFVNMLVQTERFGTPISRSLGTYSEALRTQRRQQAEEMAAKTTIKLVLPLAIFIFPCIFIVTIVPAVITVMEGFKSAF